MSAVRRHRLTLVVDRAQRHPAVPSRSRPSRSASSLHKRMRAGTDTTAGSAVTGSADHADWFPGVAIDREALTSIAAIVVGGGIVLAGFNPLDTVSARLGVGAHPALVVLTPPVLIGLFAVAVAWTNGARGLTLLKLPWPAAATVFLLVAGGILSSLASPRPQYSLALVISGVLAPALVFAAARTGRLPVVPLTAAFLATVTVFLLRADFVYLHLHGVPTSQSVLFATKFVSVPYDFHYYTLGNPDSTAGYLLLPLGVAVFWAAAPTTARIGRLWLAVVTVVIAVTLVLLYSRFAGIVAVGLVLAALLSSGLPRRVRIATAGIALAAVIGLGVGSPGHYLLDLFSSAGQSSGAVRLDSLRAGFHTLVHHPLTGVGLGTYGESPGQLAAHSSIIEAAAEMGMLGLLGVTLFTVALVTGLALSLRRRQPMDLRGAAWVAAATYALVCAFSGIAAEDLMIGFVSIYGLTLALVAGVAVAEPAGPGSGLAPLDDVLRRVLPLRGIRSRPGASSIAAGLIAIVALACLAGPLTREPSTAARSHSLAHSSATDKDWSVQIPPPRWDAATAGVLVTQAGTAVLVTTTSQPSHYQLLMPSMTLPAGAYEIVVTGRVLTGGLIVGALDPNTNRWLGASGFVADATDSGMRVMSVDFRLPHRGAAQIVLANHARRGVSHWLLRAISITRPTSDPGPIL